MVRHSLVPIVAAAFCCASATYGETESTDEAAVEALARDHFDVAQTDPLVPATAAVLVPEGLAGTVETRYSCGITFVTPTVAVTAAHCPRESFGSRASFLGPISTRVTERRAPARSPVAATGTFTSVRS